VELRLDGSTVDTVAAATNQFIGITSDTPFTAVEFVFGGGFCADGIGIDEAYYVIRTVPIARPTLTSAGGGIPDAELVSLDAGPPPTLEEALAGTVEDPGDLVVLDPNARMLSDEDYADRTTATCIAGDFGADSVELCGMTADDWNAVDPNGDGVETVKESLARQAIEANGVDVALLPVLVAAFEEAGGLQRFGSVPLFYASMEETAAPPASALLAAATTSSTTGGGRIRIGIAGKRNLTSELEELIPSELVQYLPETEVSLGSHPVKVVRNGVVSYHAGFQSAPLAGGDPAYGVFEIVLDRDSDGDGVPDDTDICPDGEDNLDADSDGLPDYCDACALDPENDVDGDGVCGGVDNCPTLPNSAQEQTGNNVGGQFGDACVDPGVYLPGSADIARDVLIGARTRVGVSVSVGSGSEIGSDVNLRSGTTVGENTVIGDGTDVRWRAQVGNGVAVGRDAVIGIDAAVDDGGVIGDNTVVRARANVGGSAMIGAGASVGINAQIGASVQVGDGARIGAGARIGDGAVISPGVRVGIRARIGAGATVNADVRAFREVPPGSAWP